jgi:hypothetical protein
MSIYTAPLKDMKFVINELAGLAEIARLPGCEDVSPTWLIPYSTKQRNSHRRCWSL